MWSIQFTKVEEKKGSNFDKLTDASQMDSIDNRSELIEEGKNASETTSQDDEEKIQCNSEVDSVEGSRTSLMEGFILIDHKDAKDEVDNLRGQLIFIFFHLISVPYERYTIILVFQ